MKKILLKHKEKIVITLFLYMLTDLCVDDNVHDSPREDTLQNISTDDLPDSASQTAQQHDSKFSFRSGVHSPAENHKNQYTNNHSRPLGRLSQIMLLIRNFWFMSSSDAKKKLRLALCSADSVALPIMAPATTRNGLPDHMDSEGRQFLCIYEKRELFVSSIFLFEVEH